MKQHLGRTPSTFLAAIAFTCLATIPRASQATKLVILTNEPGGGHARSVQSLIKSIPPFKYLSPRELSIDVQEIDAKNEGVVCRPLVVKYNDEEIKSLKYWSEQNHIALSRADVDKYRKGYTISRTLDCNKPVIATLGARFGADQVMYVISQKELGGSGGDIAIVSTASRTTTAVHEWLHTFGFGDEYAYSRQEAPAWCTKKLWPNVAVFSESGPYVDSADAVMKHRDQIPWLSALGPQPTLVKNGHLGNGDRNGLGIYPAETCKNIPELTSWKASVGRTIMDSVDYSYIPRTFWPTIFDHLGVAPERAKALMKKDEMPIIKRFMPEFKGRPDEGHI